MIYNNQDWLQEQLDIKQVLPLAKHGTRPENFVVDFLSKPVQKFNPVVENQMIGPCKFDHVSINNILALCSVNAYLRSCVKPFTNHLYIYNQTLGFTCVMNLLLFPR